MVKGRFFFSQASALGIAVLLFSRRFLPYGNQPSINSKVLVQGLTLDRRYVLSHLCGIGSNGVLTQICVRILNIEAIHIKQIHTPWFLPQIRRGEVWLSCPIGKD